DMKVSALVEAQVFRELAGGLPYPLALQLVTDEEVGGRDGTLHQIGQGVSGGFVVIGEHSGLRIVTDSKGMVTATLRAVGRSGHSAYPWQGDNALVKLQRSLANLLAAYPIATEEAWRTTVNIARIETPNQAYNQIPALAEARIDIRFPPEDTNLNGRTAAEITAYLAGFCEPGVTDPISCASTVPRTGVSTTSRARTPSSSASAATGCTGPTSTPTWPPLPPTTVRSGSSCLIPGCNRLLPRGRRTWFSGARCRFAACGRMTEADGDEREKVSSRWNQH